MHRLVYFGLGEKASNFAFSNYFYCILKKPLWGSSEA